MLYFTSPAGAYFRRFVRSSLLRHPPVSGSLPVFVEHHFVLDGKRCVGRNFGFLPGEERLVTFDKTEQRKIPACVNVQDAFRLIGGIVEPENRFRVVA